MIRSAIVGLTGALIAREIERGFIPAPLSAPILIAASRLPTPMLCAAAVAYGFYRLQSDKRMDSWVARHGVRLAAGPAAARPEMRSR